MIKNGKPRESGKRSKLEERFSSVLELLGCPERYEEVKVSYTVPASKHTYLVDFVLPNNIFIEVKGYLRDYDERHKYELIKEQNPGIDLRFVFENPDKKISRTTMTHGSWAEKHGFKYCGVADIEVINNWIEGR